MASKEYYNVERGDGFNRYVKTEHSVFKYAKRAYEKLEKSGNSSLEIKLSNTRTGLILEGFANKHVVDRGQDLIKTDAWDLENFKKNPIILFNHGLDPVVGGTPIGKAIDVKPTDDGLFVRVRISNSKSPLIQMIRDLIEEGMLKTFSVGFEAKQRDTEEIDGKAVNVIKKAELFEISVVGVPMNQDSTFEVTGKMLMYKNVDEVKSELFSSQKAWVAARADMSIIENETEHNISRRNIVKAIAKRADVSQQEVRDILGGQSLDISEDIMQAMAVVLKLDINELKRLHKGDLEAVDRLKKAQNDLIERTKAEEQVKESEMTANLVAKAKSKIPELLKANPEWDLSQIVAVSFIQVSEGEADPTREQFKELLVFATKMANGTKEMSESDEDSDENEQEKEADDKKPGYEDDSDEEDEEEKQEKQADQEEVSQISEPVQTAPTEDQFGSPFLEQAKQTNVLLGAIAAQQSAFVKEIQSLNNGISQLIQLLAGKGNNETPKETMESNDDEDNSNGDSLQLSLDNYKKRLENVKERINKMS